MSDRQIKDGVEVLIDTPNVTERVICCDCGLAHDIEYRIVDKTQLGITVWRNNRSTAQRRRYSGITIT